MITRYINTIIIDDNQGAISKLQSDLKSLYNDVRIIGGYSALDQARTMIIATQPDLIFLDMEMPEMSGLEFLESIRPKLENHVQVVFYTAHNKYIIDALRASAFDFLMKPYLLDELDIVIGRVRKNIEQNSHRSDLLNDEHRLSIPTSLGFVSPRLDEIVLFTFSGEGRHWNIMLSSGVSHRLRTTMNSKEILALNPAFMSINQNVIANINHIVSIESRSFRCTLRPPLDGQEIHASRRNYPKLRDALKGVKS